MGLTGADAQNYALSTSTLSANVGTITQLASVAYTGSNNGTWSDARNWAGGAIPDGNNVAQVIIPTNMTVVYNADQVGITGSHLLNNGTIIFSSANPFVLSNSVSGVGTLEQRGAGMLTLTGNSNMTGIVDIASYSLTLGSTNALGSSHIASSGGNLYVTNGTTLNSLAIDGSVNVMSIINTLGDQQYNGSLTFLSSGIPSSMQSSMAPNFYASTGNISFMSTVSAGIDSKSSQRSLVVSAPNGAVLLNDQVGQDVVSNRATKIQTINFSNYNQSSVSPYAVDVSAQTIKLFGDVTSFSGQQYNGSVLIGDNGSNGNTRLLLSMDPSISFSGSINDTVSGQHTLMLRALSLGSGQVPEISLGSVGLSVPLSGLDVLVGEQNQSSVVADITTNRYDYVGTVSLTGSVSTTNDQLYVANSIPLTSSASQVITFHSDRGAIEMITGLTNGSISGLQNTSFSFGAGATGLGSNLAGLGVSTQWSQPVVLIPPTNNSNQAQSPQQAQNPILAKISSQKQNANQDQSLNSDDNSIHGKLYVMAYNANKQLNNEAESSVEVGGVEGKNLVNVDCDPTLNQACSVN